ncbi:hypothetical protein BC828DRAFT_407998 [Blastocladiella britannica]|nr:hypothetical protein BC828DRAFT_407998 [Blastocladiella britannica]
MNAARDFEDELQTSALDVLHSDPEWKQTLADCQLSVSAPKCCHSEEVAVGKLPRGTTATGTGPAIASGPKDITAPDTTSKGKKSARLSLPSPLAPPSRHRALFAATADPARVPLLSSSTLLESYDIKDKNDCPRYASVSKKDSETAAGLGRRRSSGNRSKEEEAYASLATSPSVADFESEFDDDEEKFGPFSSAIAANPVIAIASWATTLATPATSDPATFVLPLVPLFLGGECPWTIIPAAVLAAHAPAASTTVTSAPALASTLVAEPAPAPALDSTATAVHNNTESTASLILSASLANIFAALDESPVIALDLAFSVPETAVTTPLAELAADAASTASNATTTASTLADSASSFADSASNAPSSASTLTGSADLALASALGSTKPNLFAAPTELGFLLPLEALAPLTMEDFIV